MNGPDHYREAERLLGNAWTYIDGGRGGLLHTHEVRADLIASAQAHATLAHTAATVEATNDQPGPLTPRLVRCDPTGGSNHEYERSAWAEAIS